VLVYVPVNDLESLWALSVVLGVLYDPTGVLVLVLDSTFVNVLVVGLEMEMVKTQKRVRSGPC